MALFFTSDLHFGHANIIKYCDRPFGSVEDMDAALIKNWNHGVSQDDIVYILGDMFFCQDKRAAEILGALRGRKKLILGNHDKLLRKSRHLQSFFEEVLPPLHEEVIDKVPVVMCHYPLASWNRAFHGAFMLHGHVHGREPLAGNVRRFDVGVDANAYLPVEWSVLRETLGRIEVRRGRS